MRCQFFIIFISKTMATHSCFLLLPPPVLLLLLLLLLLRKASKNWAGAVVEHVTCAPVDKNTPLFAHS